MVNTPDTLSESCAAMGGALEKLQPKLQISHLAVAGDTWLQGKFPSKPKSVNLAVSSLLNEARKCSICSSLLSTEKHLLLFQSVDYEDLEISPSKLSVVCSHCNTISCFGEIVNIYLAAKIGQTTNLSELIEHYMSVNGCRDVGVFDAAISLSVSMRKSMERLDFSYPEVDTLNVKDFIVKYTH